MRGHVQYVEKQIMTRKYTLKDRKRTYLSVSSLFKALLKVSWLGMPFTKE